MCRLSSHGQLSPIVEAGLFNPRKNTSAEIALNGTPVANVTSADPASNVWLTDGNNTIVVALNKKTADAYTFVVQPGMRALPDSGNTFSCAEYPIANLETGIAHSRGEPRLAALVGELGRDHGDTVRKLLEDLHEHEAAGRIDLLVPSDSCGSRATMKVVV